MRIAAFDGSDCPYLAVGSGQAPSISCSECDATRLPPLFAIVPGIRRRPAFIPAGEQEHADKRSAQAFLQLCLPEGGSVRESIDQVTAC